MRKQVKHWQASCQWHDQWIMPRKKVLVLGRHPFLGSIDMLPRVCVSIGLEETMKQFLLGTPVGRIVMSGRDKFQLVRAALGSAENIGTMANDQLAAFLITRLCQPNKTFVDVGAHIGSIISEVLHHEPSIKCIAVEAMPEKVANLRRKFPGVEIHGCAAGDCEGEMTFYVNLRQSGYSSLGRPAKAESENVREIRVPVRQLDSLVPASGVDAVKIDVEGAELGVLRGSVGILAANKPTIMFESGPARDDGLGHTKEALWQFLSDCGYAVLVPNRLAHNDAGLSQEGFCESHLYPRRTTNYFAVAKERRAEICERARRILGVHVS